MNNSETPPYATENSMSFSLLKPLYCTDTYSYEMYLYKIISSKLWSKVSIQALTQTKFQMPRWNNYFCMLNNWNHKKRISVLLQQGLCHFGRKCNNIISLSSLCYKWSYHCAHYRIPPRCIHKYLCIKYKLQLTMDPIDCEKKRKACGYS